MRMRASPNIIVKKKRIGSNYCDIDLPKIGQSAEFGNNRFLVSKINVRKVCSMHEAELVMDTDDGGLTLSLVISSVKPFRTR